MHIPQTTNRMRVLRAERRMSQADLSRKARINKTRISFLENGHFEPSSQEKKRIARAFGVTVSEVFIPIEPIAIAG